MERGVKTAIAFMCLYENARGGDLPYLPQDFFVSLEELIWKSFPDSYVLYSSKVLHFVHRIPCLRTIDMFDESKLESPAQLFDFISESKHVSYIATQKTHAPNIEDGFITCRCGSKKVKWTEKQMRSADEGSTVFLQCTSCGRKWKMNS